jgi:energy-coupling factor transporter ATP-binding protein EcfA2
VTGITTASSGGPVLAMPVGAMDKVSVTFAAAELAAVFGPSGSGKSTLLHLMGILDRPALGTVRVTELDLARMIDREPSGLRELRGPGPASWPPTRWPGRAGSPGRPTADSTVGVGRAVVTGAG